MDNSSEKKARSGSRRAVIALTSCVFGAALILVASQIGPKLQDKTGTAGEESSVKPEQKKTRRAWNIALGNVVVVLLFAASWMLRYDSPPNPESLALTCSFLGVCLALVTGWLGGELVDRLGIGVDDEANPDAPSSLKTGKTAHSSPTPSTTRSAVVA